MTTFDQTINDQLKREMSELKNHVKQLEEYRDELVMKSCPNEEQSVKSAFESLLDLTTNGLIQCEKYVHSSSMDQMNIVWSVRTINTDTINCLGCGQSFNMMHTAYEHSFYIHCIKECDKYKDLNLIRECDTCKRIFINADSMNNHLCDQPPKPDWMTPSMYHNGITKGYRKGKGYTKCVGCGNRFSFPRHHSYDHLVHMVEDCSAYKDLNLITECHQCHYKFPNQKTCTRHATKTHFMKKPKWMTKGIFSSGMMASRSRTSPVPCRGCSKELRKCYGRKTRAKYRFEDYVHMIEKCPRYKKLNLIRTCNKCDCKFITPKGFGQHKC